MTTEVQTFITVTPEAANKIQTLIDEQQESIYGLRIFVSGGGCSGMQYGMAFEENPQPNDEMIEVDGIRVVVDPNSLDYVHGATIDYVDNLMGGGFRIENPNAVASCGCGSSFRTEGSDPGPGYGGGGCY